MEKQKYGKYTNEAADSAQGGSVPHVSAGQRVASSHIPRARGHAEVQYPNRLLTMFCRVSPFSNREYCSRKKRIAC